MPIDGEDDEYEDFDEGQKEESEEHDSDDGQADEEGPEEVEDEGSDDSAGDGGEEEGEGEDSLEAEAEEEEDDPLPLRKKLPSEQRRSQNSFQRERQRRIDAERRAGELEANQRAQEARDQVTRAEAARRAQEDESSRLAEMTPEERVEYRLNRMSQTIEYNRQMDLFRASDTADKANFVAMCRVDPVYKRHQARVESALAQLRSQGQNMPRETILTYAVGEETLKASKESKKRITPQQIRKVPKHTTSRADVSRAQRSKKPSSEKQRIVDQWGDTPL
jgi:hypothetical protein